MARVAVTTTTDRSIALAAELVAVGVEPVPLPSMEVRRGSDVDLARARAAAEEADLIVLTSSRPLDVLWPHGDMPPTPVAAVGPATAVRVARYGGRVDFVGRGGSIDLSQRLVPRVAGMKVAYPHAAGGDPRCAVALSDAAAQLVAVPVYRFVPKAPGLDPVDAAVFTSAPAVEGWFLSRTLDDIVVGAIGLGAESTLRRRGRVADVLCWRPSYARLARALAGYLAA